MRTRLLTAALVAATAAIPGSAHACGVGVGSCFDNTSTSGSDTCTMVPTSLQAEMYCVTYSGSSSVTITSALFTNVQSCAGGRRIDVPTVPGVPVTLTLNQTSSGSSYASIRSE